MSLFQNNDITALRDSVYNSTISGPWRLTVWEKDGHPPCYIFAEEHESHGSCPEERDISSVLREILDKTRSTEVFIEHFVHAGEITNARVDPALACAARSSSILNGLRLCLEVTKITNAQHAERIHFCDPRCDIVCIMPDGKVYEAIQMYVTKLARDGNVAEALLTLYEAFIHPLLTVVPDTKRTGGRLSGVIKKVRDLMSYDQLEFFDETWKADVVTSIKDLTQTYTSMHEAKDITNVAEFMTQYTTTINKFMDTWLLAQMFHSENNGMSSSVLYLGSLHSLNMEKYLERYGYRRTSINENKNLYACLDIK